MTLHHKLQANETAERYKASPEALYRQLLKTPPDDSLQEIFAVLQAERGDLYNRKVNFPRDSGNTKNHHFGSNSQLS